MLKFINQDRKIANAYAYVITHICEHISQTLEMDCPPDRQVILNIMKDANALILDKK